MSEFSLIYQHFKHATASHPLTQVGIGDDCAVSDIPPNTQLVSCVDVLVAGRHFPATTCAYAIGYKSVAVNLSDLAAMAATPYAILLGLSMPKALANAAWVSEFSRGLAACCAPFGVELIGGDTTRSEVLTISVTALGYVPTGHAMLRSGAKVGDIICLSGEIGSASFALQQLLAHKPTALQAALDLPPPQVALGKKLSNFANSMIDISDGLGQDLGHMLTASQVGALIELEKLPTHPHLQSLPNPQRWQHQLNGGDDYQLCLTISPNKFAEFNQKFPNLVYPIGTITASPGLQLRYHGEPITMQLNGYQHF